MKDQTNPSINTSYKEIKIRTPGERGYCKPPLAGLS